jgi:hypothetical protein
MPNFDTAKLLTRSWSGRERNFVCWVLLCSVLKVKIAHSSYRAYSETTSNGLVA